MATHTVNFRATSTFVTDGTDETYDLGAQYPVTRASITFGWANDNTGSARDRSSTADRRLAGLNQGEAQATRTWRVDLSGTGDWQINSAHGDVDGPQRQDVEYGDNTTYETIGDNVFTDGGQFMDATAVVRTSAANWVSSNATKTKNFTSTIFNVRLGNLTATLSSSTMNSIKFVSAGGGVGDPPSDNQDLIITS